MLEPFTPSEKEASRKGLGQLGRPGVADRPRSQGEGIRHELRQVRSGARDWGCGADPYKTRMELPAAEKSRLMTTCEKKQATQCVGRRWSHESIQGSLGSGDSDEVLPPDMARCSGSAKQPKVCADLEMRM